MKTSARRLTRWAAALALLVALSAQASPVAAAAPTRVTVDTYFAAGYERQIDGETCTAASTAMMMNFISGRDLNLNQRTVLKYEKPRDALGDRLQRGSDPLGWSLAATYFSANSGDQTTYRWVAYPSKTAAFNAAARAIAKVHKPVGLLVWNGGHAIVMTGFGATADPNKGAFTLTKIMTSDPYSRGATVGKHRTWTPSALPFGKYLQRDATRAYNNFWYGKWIVIVPVD